MNDFNEEAQQAENVEDERIAAMREFVNLSENLAITRLTVKDMEKKAAVLSERREKVRARLMDVINPQQVSAPTLDDDNDEWQPSEGIR